jgi:hypothetical protein
MRNPWIRHNFKDKRLRPHCPSAADVRLNRRGGGPPRPPCGFRSERARPTGPRASRRSRESSPRSRSSRATETSDCGQKRAGESKRFACTQTLRTADPDSDQTEALRAGPEGGRLLQRRLRFPPLQFTPNGKDKAATEIANRRSALSGRARPPSLRFDEGQREGRG